MLNINKFIFALLVCLFYHAAYSKNIDPKKLDAEISKLNDEHKYEESIIRLTEIIRNPKSTSYDKYNAYLQKYLTYKRLYNYALASENLNYALREGLRSNKSREVETRVLVEKIFVHFDLQEFDKVKQLIKKVNLESLIDSETKAFYISVLATLELQRGDYRNAEKNLDLAIQILEKEKPRHLPNIYRKKVVLYDKTKEPKKAIEAYKKGLFYAEKYNIDIYKIIMYEAITKYYSDNHDYKNALNYQKKVSQERTKYNAANNSGKLNILEAELTNKHKNLELRNERNIKFFLITLTIFLCLLILVMFKLFKMNKRQRLIIEQENARMRLQLQKLSTKWEGKIELENYNLTHRQREIINLVKQGKTNKEIGILLFISENTVKYHLKIIYEILNIANRMELQ